MTAATLERSVPTAELARQVVRAELERVTRPRLAIVQPVGVAAPYYW